MNGTAQFAIIRIMDTASSDIVAPSVLFGSININCITRQLTRQAIAQQVNKTVLRKLYKLRKINHGVVEIAMTKETRDKPEKADLSKVNSRLAEGSWDSRYQLQNRCT